MQCLVFVMLHQSSNRSSKSPSSPQSAAAAFPELGAGAARLLVVVVVGLKLGLALKPICSKKSSSMDDGGSFLTTGLSGGCFVVVAAIVVLVSGGGGAITLRTGAVAGVVVTPTVVVVACKGFFMPVFLTLRPRGLSIGLPLLPPKLLLPDDPELPRCCSMAAERSLVVKSTPPLPGELLR